MLQYNTGNLQTLVIFCDIQLLRIIGSARILGED